MNKITKIVLSIPPVILLFFIISFWFPAELDWLTPKSETYQIKLFTIIGSNLMTMVYLIFRILSFKFVLRSIRTEWIWIVIVIYLPASLYYIWFKDAEFEILNDG
ncbi:MAG: hypothetical protein HKN54_00740 [Flavobacteriaceae bacterium]|nr:hypothetical protein [Flavobacteriaceae bacterium]